MRKRKNAWGRTAASVMLAGVMLVTAAPTALAEVSQPASQAQDRKSVV